MQGGAQTPHDNTSAARPARRGLMPNPGPQASPRPKEQRAAGEKGRRGPRDPYHRPGLPLRRGRKKGPQRAPQLLTRSVAPTAARSGDAVGRRVRQ
ncbi:hypothetical protein NDU88_005114 [Pleurodeles waltl]|uniref:Uncharacterized protein n=1 Tax=Pleurodeles waltl TaxID=8319 RepID=A0AAV7NN01_PLEWA|nr:hypothetical protein NDU88_005114 [Pleurodeles waltl]